MTPFFIPSWCIRVVGNWNFTMAFWATYQQNLTANLAALFWIFCENEKLYLEMFEILSENRCETGVKFWNDFLRHSLNYREHLVFTVKSRDFWGAKVKRADLTCDVIKKVAPFVLSKLWILIDDWSMCWSRDTVLIKLRLYSEESKLIIPVCWSKYNIST